MAYNIFLEKLEKLLMHHKGEFTFKEKENITIVGMNGYKYIYFDDRNGPHVKNLLNDINNSLENNIPINYNFDIRTNISENTTFLIYFMGLLLNSGLNQNEMHHVFKNVYSRLPSLALMKNCIHDDKRAKLIPLILEYTVYENPQSRNRPITEMMELLEVFAKKEGYVKKQQLPYFEYVSSLKKFFANNEQYLQQEHLHAPGYTQNTLDITQRITDAKEWKEFAALILGQQQYNSNDENLITTPSQQNYIFAVNHAYINKKFTTISSESLIKNTLNFICEKVVELQTEHNEMLPGLTALSLVASLKEESLIAVIHDNPDIIEQVKNIVFDSVVHCDNMQLQGKPIFAHINNINEMKEFIKIACDKALLMAELPEKNSKPTMRKI